MGDCSGPSSQPVLIAVIDPESVLRRNDN